MKKIITHLKENWIRHGFETLVVVFGILMAFSLNNWREGVKEKKEKNILLKGIQSEMLINRKELTRVMEIHQTGKEHLLSLLQLFEEESLTQPRSFYDSLWRNATRFKILFASYDPQYGNVKSIISSGKLGYLSNEELATQIASFEDQVNDTNETVPNLYKLFYDHINLIAYDYIPVSIPNGKQLYQSDYNRFFADKKLLLYLNLLYHCRNGILIEEGDLLIQIDKILGLIEEELDDNR